MKKQPKPIKAKVVQRKPGIPVRYIRVWDSDEGFTGSWRSLNAIQKQPEEVDGTHVYELPPPEDGR